MDNKDLPAFPITLKPGEVFDGMTNINGLSKREYIAAMVLSGLLSNTDYNIAQNNPSIYAGDVLRYTDALLKELEK
jgi:hypothetical protein